MSRMSKGGSDHDCSETSSRPQGIGPKGFGKWRARYEISAMVQKESDLDHARL